MTYASEAELTTLTGTTLPTNTLTAILEEADRQIKNRLALSAVSPPTADDKLKSAALALGRVGLLLWGPQEEVDNILITELKANANAAVDSYIAQSQDTTTGERIWVRKVNP